MNLARAKSKEDKQQKHLAIMNAALELFKQQQSLPTVATIAQASGQAKGTVYLYFSSKESIYLALLARDYHSWFEQINHSLANQGGLSELLVAFLQYPLQEPSFLNLANLSSAMLEPAVDPQCLSEFYDSFNHQSLTLAQAISQQFSQLTPHQSLSLVSDSHALILGLWQQRKRQPQLNFESSAKAALARLWKGYFSQ